MTDHADTVNADAKVVDINQPPKGKAKREKADADKNSNNDDKPKPPKKARLDQNIFLAITTPFPLAIPQPDFRIEVVEILPDVLVAVQINEAEECKKVSDKALAKLIMEYTRTSLAGLPDYLFSAKDCRECVDYWQMASRALPNPPHVRFKSDPGLCWNRLPFDCEPGPTPIFDELFSRMGTNADAVKAWIGSLFIPTSFLQQYIWLYGVKGNDGKSSLFKFIAKCLGKQGSLAQTKAPSGEHWAEPYPGKRFIYFPDFKDHAQLAKGPLKQLTGDDAITINPKNHPIYDAELEAKYAFSSNEMPPSYSIDPAILRRIIFTEMTPRVDAVKNHDAKYQQKMWAEGGAFLHSCIEMYHRLCPTDGPIPISDESLDQLAAWGAKEGDDYQLWFDKYFKMHETGKIAPNALTVRIQHDFKDHHAKRACYDWLEKSGIRRKRESSGERRWFYHGLQVRTDSPSSSESPLDLSWK